MALGTFIAGRYGVTWGGTAIGMSRQGFELEFQFKQELIDESDLYGLTTLDAVLRGADTYLSATLREYKAGSKAILWALGGGALGTIYTVAKPPGILASDQAQSLVMTSTANTPAAASPATLTASKAFTAPNYNPRLLFDSRLREVPIRMMFYPYASGADLIHFSTT